MQGERTSSRHVTRVWRHLPGGRAGSKGACVAGRTEAAAGS